MNSEELNVSEELAEEFVGNPVENEARKLATVIRIWYLSHQFKNWTPEKDL